MRVKVMITGVEVRKGTSPKTGKPYELHGVTAVDMSTTKRCKTPLEFNLNDVDKDLSDSLEGQTVLIDITSLKVFNGRLDVSAAIVRGEPVTAEV